jgi:hypothetical protein
MISWIIALRSSQSQVLVKLMIGAQLKQHGSYMDITEHLRSSSVLQAYLGLPSISESQLSRKLRTLPHTLCQRLFLSAVSKLQELTRDSRGIPGLGRLRIIDSTELALPEIAGRWAYCSKHKNAVTMHTRLVVTAPDTAYPERIIASTADVADSEVVMELVVDDDAIHVMDRGYIVYGHFAQWTEQHKRFVVRIQQRNKVEILHERPAPKGSKVLRDADVAIRFQRNGEMQKVELRLVEFTDEKGKLYRLLTNVYDHTAEQICEIYRHRWMIELFFKWIKGHLKLVKLYTLFINPAQHWKSRSGSGPDRAHRRSGICRPRPCDPPAPLRSERRSSPNAGSRHPAACSQ